MEARQLFPSLRPAGRLTPGKYLFVRLTWCCSCRWAHHTSGLRVGIFTYGLTLSSFPVFCFWCCSCRWSCLPVPPCHLFRVSHSSRFSGRVYVRSGEAWRTGPAPQGSMNLPPLLHGSWTTVQPETVLSLIPPPAHLTFLALPANTMWRITCSRPLAGAQLQQPPGGLPGRPPRTKETCKHRRSSPMRFRYRPDLSTGAVFRGCSRSPSHPYCWRRAQPEPRPIRSSLESTKKSPIRV